MQGRDLTAFLVTREYFSRRRCSGPRAGLGPYPITLVEVDRAVVLDRRLNLLEVARTAVTAAARRPLTILCLMTTRTESILRTKRLSSAGRQGRDPLGVNIFVQLYFSSSGENRAGNRERRASAFGRRGRATDGSLLLLALLFLDALER